MPWCVVHGKRIGAGTRTRPALNTGLNYILDGSDKRVYIDIISFVDCFNCFF